MKDKNIDILLEKYYECSASEEEEEQLREYFLHEKLDAKYNKYKSQFTVFQNLSIETLDTNFVKKLEKKFKKNQTSVQSKFHYYVEAGIAACIILFITMPYMSNTNDEITQKEAREEIKYSLKLISNNFNLAVEGMETMHEGINEVNDIQYFDEGLKEIRKINKILKK